MGFLVVLGGVVSFSLAASVHKQDDDDTDSDRPLWPPRPVHLRGHVATVNIDTSMLFQYKDITWTVR